ncbi:MAG: FecR domain-containing protein [Parasphingorhabdus sp.]|nr:FecR domain-containing protein [Parasphingorhabdus sp.]
MAQAARIAMERLKYCLLIVGLALVVVQPVEAQPVETVDYSFQRGDTLMGLAAKYMRRVTDYRIVQRLNRIADPRSIPVGAIVQIPVALLKYRASSANIAAYRGNVAVALAGRQLPVAQGMALAEGSVVATAANSFVTIRLEDGTLISLPSNSAVTIGRLRRILLTDSIDHEFAVTSGSMRSRVAPLQRPEDRYRVRTPAAVSAVRGTDFRNRVDAVNSKSFSETVEGSVDVLAKGSTSAVPVLAGQGAAVADDGGLQTAKLLEPPVLVEPAKIQSDAQLRFAAEPGSGSVAWRYLLAADAGFIDVLAEARSETAEALLPSLPNGRYFVKATAFDAAGFEGLPVVYGFKRVLSTLSASADATDFGYRFAWQGEGSGVRRYHFQLLRGSKDALAMVDEPGLEGDNIILSDLPPGEYYWRVGITQFADGERTQKWGDFEKLNISE